jgi:hypothetical protein
MRLQVCALNQQSYSSYAPLLLPLYKLKSVSQLWQSATALGIFSLEYSL